MNRAQFWLLLLLGVILLGTAAFWIFDRSPGAILTDTVSPTLADSPVQIDEIAARRPNMMLISGKAPANQTLTLRLAGNKIGTAKSDANGKFQITTNPLPRDENLDLTLEYGGEQPLNLFIIDRRPQPVALINAGGRNMPLQRPLSGTGILLVEALDPPNYLHIVGQSEQNAIVYAYANNVLVGKAYTADHNNATPKVFEMMLDDRTFPQKDGRSELRFDIYSLNGELITRSTLDLNNEKAWQAYDSVIGGENYIWRDLSAQISDTKKVYPGQFTPVVETVPTADVK